MTVSVVIPCRDAADTVGAQVAAVAGQRLHAAFEVVVVDDGSSDGSDTLVAAIADRDPRVRLLRMSPGGEGGASRARNVGASAARGGLVAFCDADDLVAPGWLRGLVDAAGSADLVGGRLEHARLNDPRRRIWRAAGPMVALPTSLHFLPFAYGANLAARRSLLERIGGFDENLPTGEDVDLCWRAQLAGSTLAYAPDAVVHYRHRATVRSAGRQAYRYGLSEPLLLARYRRYGARRAAPRETLRRYLYLATRLPYLLASTRRRGLWCVVAAGEAGRLVGTVRAWSSR